MFALYVLSRLVLWEWVWTFMWLLDGDYRRHKLRLTSWHDRRRTRQSGPLGELFDHGVDALNTSLEVLIFAASQNMGQSWYTVAMLFACEFSLSMDRGPRLQTC